MQLKGGKHGIVCASQEEDGRNEGKPLPAVKGESNMNLVEGHDYSLDYQKPTETLLKTGKKGQVEKWECLLCRKKNSGLGVNRGMQGRIIRGNDQGGRRQGKKKCPAKKEEKDPFTMRFYVR